MMVELKLNEIIEVRDHITRDFKPSDQFHMIGHDERTVKAKSLFSFERELEKKKKLDRLAQMVKDEQAENE